MKESFLFYFIFLFNYTASAGRSRGGLYRYMVGHCHPCFFRTLSGGEEGKGENKYGLDDDKRKERRRGDYVLLVVEMEMGRF